MKQCPTCGHRTNDDVCPVCGAATVVLQNDPQEKAQRTIQYQRFDPSKAPGATAGGHAVPTGNRYTQKDPGAMHHMQQRAGAVSQSHPAKAAPQPNPQEQQEQSAHQPASQATQPQQPAAGESRNITYQHVNEFRPSTLPRRSQKYRQKYASYVPNEPIVEPHQTPNPAAQAPNAGAPAPQQMANAPIEPASAQQTATGQQASQPVPTTQAVPEAQATQPIPPTPESEELHTENSTEAQAADEKPTAPHVLLSPKELEEFLDNQPDDGEEDGLPEMQEGPETAEPTEHTEIEAESENPNSPHPAAAPETVMTSGHAAGPNQEEAVAPKADSLDGSSDNSEPDSSETPKSFEIPDKADSIVEADAIDNANNTSIADQTAGADNTDDPAENGESGESGKNGESGENNESEGELEEEHLPTRQELIQKQNARIRRENNRKYAEEHASRAARRWQKESQEEPFAIVRGTCYYSALESETTVRGNFSKKRYKDDVLPQSEPVSYEDSEWYQGFENAYDPWGDYAEPDEKEKKKGVSYKAWFIILLLIIFWPAGLILMWVRKKFPLAVRIIITLIIAAGLAFEGYFLYHYGPAMYEEYMYGDSSNITYKTPSSDSGSSDSDTTQSAAATENQQKALDEANEYIDTLALSHDGLIKQLEYDGYSTDVATYAADNCGANWNKEAKEMAEQYMESTTYTYKAMVQQLEAEGFTRDQAKFGARAVGLE